MNEQERFELEALKRRQAQLQQELNSIGHTLASLEQRLSHPVVPAVPPVITFTGAPTPHPAFPFEKTPQLHASQAVPKPIVVPQATTAPAFPPAQPVSSPLHSKAVPAAAATRGDSTVRPEPTGTFSAMAKAQAPESFQPSAPAAAAKEPASFEMRLGTYWLVRIGIVMLLTGLAFFGNYAYQNFISKFGAAGKVALLYLMSAGLLGAGWWWQRKVVKETLRNYAQVLFAGGLAAFYFTTYAAHHFPNLRVIQSATKDGLLLLLWAGFIVWIANRKKSEVLALFAILLAYYTAIISHEVGLFTLYSNLLLTVAAVYFMVRNRWTKLSFASLSATYAAYGFWRFLHGGEWRWAYPEEGLWTGTYFLMSYWAIFTAAVFLSRHSGFSKENRSSFLTLNNGAFFTMFLLTMLQVHQGGFWKFSLIYGAVLLGLAFVAKVVLPAEPLTENAYLTQGLLLATAGLISHPRLAGLNLALVLAVESITLLMAGQMRRNLILLIGAYITATLAVGWGMDGMMQHEPHGMWLGMGLGGLMLADCLLAHRHALSREAVSGNAAAGASQNPVAGIPAAGSLFRLRVAYFAALALAIWFAATYDNSSTQNFPLVLAAEGLLLTFSLYALGVPEITLLAQMYLFIGQLVWTVENVTENGPKTAWYKPVLMIGMTLAAGHWWQMQKQLRVRAESRWFLQGLYGLAVVGVLYLWVSSGMQPDHWLAVSGLLALALTVYAALTRAWLLCACGQLFIGVTIFQFVGRLAGGHPLWWMPLTPVAVLLMLSAAARTWFQRNPGAGLKLREPIFQLALVYRAVAAGMCLWWIAKYIPERERIWVYALAGVLLFAFAGLRRTKESLIFSAVFTLAGFILFWLDITEQPAFYLPTLLAIVTLLVEQRLAKGLPGRYAILKEAHAAAIIVGGLSIWLFLSRWVLAAQFEQHAYLTASWSLLALVLFGCGIVTHERVYRWLGLGILACAVGRVVIVDVWRLEVIYRVLSFMALGGVLLVLGFIYSKYQEKIREWL